MSILELIPQEQLDRVFSQEFIDIDPEFMGFLDIYENLSKIIPKHYTVVDLGCAYNPQSFFFKDHSRVLSVDLPLGKIERFKSDNCEIFEMSIREFIEKHISSLKLETTFAICSYVPPWQDDNMRLVRDSFINVFTFYPHSSPEQDRVYSAIKKCKLFQGGDYV